MEGYEPTNVYGKLYCGDCEYWLISPHPVEWDNTRDTNERGFLGVSVDDWGFGGAGNDQVYTTPHLIIVSGTYHIVMKPPTRGWIWCKSAELADDFFNDAVADPVDVLSVDWLSSMAEEFEYLKEID